MSDEIPLRQSEVNLININPNAGPNEQNQEENKYGFGEPEQRRVFDLDDFEEDLDTKQGRKYDKSYWNNFKKQKKDQVGEEFKNFKDGGDFPTYFDDNESDEEEQARFTKMPSSISEIMVLEKLISSLLFGDKSDKFLDGVNRFVRNIENFITALSENAFPQLILILLYAPLVFVVMILNCLRESILWWIVAILIFMICFALIGALCALLFIGYRGYKIYTKRFDEDGKPRKRNAEEDDDAGLFGFDSDDNYQQANEEEKKEGPSDGGAQFEGGDIITDSPGPEHRSQESDSPRVSYEYDSNSSLKHGINPHKLDDMSPQVEVIEDQDTFPALFEDKPDNRAFCASQLDIEKFGDQKKAATEKYTGNGSNKRTAPSFRMNKEDNY